MKRLIILAVIIFRASLMQSQTITLQTGPSFSKLAWENSIIDRSYFNLPATGFNVTLGVDYLNLKYLNLSSNFGMIQKGGRDDVMYAGVELYGGEPIVTVKMNYLTLNTTVNFKVPVKDFVFPYVSVGPRVDYLVSYKEDIEFIKQFEDSDALNKFTYGMIAGAGIDFKVNNLTIGPCFEYYFNFNKIVDNTSEFGAYNSIKDHTFIVDVKVGYRL